MTDHRLDPVALLRPTLHGDHFDQMIGPVDYFRSQTGEGALSDDVHLVLGKGWDTLPDGSQGGRIVFGTCGRDYFICYLDLRDAIAVDPETGDWVPADEQLVVVIKTTRFFPAEGNTTVESSKTIRIFEDSTVVIDEFAGKDDPNVLTRTVMGDAGVTVFDSPRKVFDWFEISERAVVRTYPKFSWLAEKGDRWVFHGEASDPLFGIEFATACRDAGEDVLDEQGVPVL